MGGGGGSGYGKERPPPVERMAGSRRCLTCKQQQPSSQTPAGMHMHGPPTLQQPSQTTSAHPGTGARLCAPAAWRGLPAGPAPAPAAAQSRAAGGVRLRRRRAHFCCTLPLVQQLCLRPATRQYRLHLTATLPSRGSTAGAHQPTCASMEVSAAGAAGTAERASREGLHLSSSSFSRASPTRAAAGRGNRCR